MEMRRVGSLEVSVAGLGCNNFGMRIDEAASKQVVDAALDAGVNHFDTADIYGKGQSEEFLGRALGSRRDEAVITTQGRHARSPEGEHGGSEAYITAHCDESLARLGTDRIDLYLLHQPDPETPIAETLSAFAKLVADGQGARDRVLQLQRRAARRGRAGGEGPRRPAVRERAERLQPAQPLGGGRRAPGVRAPRRLLMPYFPLASGMLTGKYRRGEEHPEGSRLAAWGPMAGQFASDERFDVVERLEPSTRRRTATRSRARALVAGGHAGGRQRDRGCHVARAGARQRRRHHRVGAHRRRAGRGRRARARRRLSRRRTSAASPSSSCRRDRWPTCRGRRAVACSRSSTTSSSIRRVRCSLRALDGVGAREAARARHPRGCATRPRCWRRSRRRPWRCGTVRRSAPARSCCSRPTSASSAPTRRWRSPRWVTASCRAGAAPNA